MTETPRILYCNCTYAQVVPKAVKEAVLKRLSESDIAFEAVADLCEMSARQDSSLKRLANCKAVKIAACYPRAVKWLFAAAGAPLNADATQVLNMRTLEADDVISGVFDDQLEPNIPHGKETRPAPSELPAP